MKIRTHRHTIKFPIFSDYCIFVVFTDSIKNACKHITDVECREDSAAVTVINSDGYSTIVLPHSATAEMVAHESSHAVWALMSHVGADLEDEVVAYHIGHVVGLITNWSKRSVVRASVKRYEGCGPIYGGKRANA